ncbi:unnamed protein product [Chondrus crispus]|uniref:Rhodanese domain-containing protein n=1 Tax=Chondrus crispus TaxID=2769 RepID=R7QKH8_CHOCR|nr:unnamed protein product [Chondrus crispus]CDF37910.1 unnamed protein product [Chondrus crispus]|eukprot:XP_005717781.1 unnamed protein product [Chondrus crispus]
MPVSLFYHYTDVKDVEDLATRLRSLGPPLGLAGRIRVSAEGINGTFGGSEAAVEKFHRALLSELQLADLDFKVSPGSAENFPGGWKIRICRELVTLGVAEELASWRDAAPHIGPNTFRKEVLSPSKDVVVLDVRNQYEHAIGRFKGAVLPSIRQFSDLPKYIRENKERFRDRRVLMYCTGGIRCERASALLRNMDIVKSIGQLHGGIDRFLKQYPCGGDAFQGKNLVFDTRLALGTTQATTVGKCVACKGLWDDYSKGWRCIHCRSRVLLCNSARCTEYFYKEHGGCCRACHSNMNAGGPL